MAISKQAIASMLKSKKAIAKMLREKREAIGITKAECANRLEVTILTYLFWESADRFPRKIYLEAIAHHLGFDKESELFAQIESMDCDENS